MKKITTTFALLTLLLGAWNLRVLLLPKPIPTLSSKKSSSIQVSTTLPLSPLMAQPSDDPSAILVPHLGENSSPLQSSWAREVTNLKSLASHDPQAALTVAKRLATKEERDDAVMAVCLEIAARDPAHAVALAWDFQRDQFDGPGAGPALENLARQWAAKDLSAALAWARAQPSRENDTRREHIFKGLVSTLSRTTPSEASRLITEQIPAGAVQFAAAITVLDDWMVHDFPMAASWIGGLPQGGLREALFDHLASMDSQRLPASLSEKERAPSFSVHRASPL